MAFAAPKKLVFLHIPKTAGSSVGAWLDAQFEPHEIVKIYAGNAREQLQEALQNPTVRFIRGHFGLYEPLLVELENPNVIIITFLREPVQRIISLYNHMQRRLSEKHNTRMKKVNSIGDFLKLKTDYNEQTRYLSGVEDKKTFQRNGEAAFTSALKNGAKLDFVGFTESINDDLKKLAAFLDFKPEDLPQKNKGLSMLKQIVLNAIYHHAILKVEVYDLKLYDELKEVRL
jgi:hypothetical protein